MVFVDTNIPMYLVGAPHPNRERLQAPALRHVRAKVCLDPGFRREPAWCVEVKWSDRPPSHPEELSGVFALANRYPDISASVTTRTIAAQSDSWPGANPLEFTPTSLYCYEVGRSLTRHDGS